MNLANFTRNTFHRFFPYETKKLCLQDQPGTWCLWWKNLRFSRESNFANSANRHFSAIFCENEFPQNWKSLILSKINFLKVLQEVLEIPSSRKWKSPLVVNYLTESNLDFTLKTAPKLFIRSKWTIETLGKGEKYVSFINFEHISLHFLVFLLMDLNR